MIAMGMINQSPDMVASKFLSAIREEGKSHIMTSHYLPKPGRFKLLVYTSTYLFNLHLSELNRASYNGTYVAVIAPPISLFEFNLIPFDYSISEDLHVHAFEYKKPDYTDLVDVLVERTPGSLLEAVLSNLKNIESILTVFMTFIYSMPSATHQKPVKEEVFKWMNTDESLEQLEVRINALEPVIGAKLNAKQMRRLFTIMDTDVTRTYRKALKDLSHLDDKMDPEVQAYADSKGISAYDIRYILSILSTC